MASHAEMLDCAKRCAPIATKEPVYRGVAAWTIASDPVRDRDVAVGASQPAAVQGLRTTGLRKRDFTGEIAPISTSLPEEAGQYEPN
jgi:hypothetical protein